jgi:hypothetical protein
MKFGYFTKFFTAVLFLFAASCSSTSDKLFSDSENGSSKSTSESSYDGDSTYVSDGSFFDTKIATFKEEYQGIKSLFEKRKARLDKYRADTKGELEAYRRLVSEVKSKLQMGTTPSNPDLLDKWREARAKLENISNIAFDMKRLAADVEADASMTDYMLDSINAAYRVRGATEAHHRELKSIEKNVRDLSVGITRFSTLIEDESEKQLDFVESEKYNLNDLALSIKEGGRSATMYDPYGSTDFMGSTYEAGSTDFYSSYGSQSLFGGDNMSSFASSEPVVLNRGTKRSMKGKSIEDRGRPLVAIKFDRNKVDYEEPLYQALSRALERDREARFEIVGVSPRRYSSSVQRHVGDVAKTLTQMGMPASRISISSQMGVDSVSTDEVHVYYVK